MVHNVSVKSYLVNRKQQTFVRQWSAVKPREYPMWSAARLNDLPGSLTNFIPNIYADDTNITTSNIIDINVIETKLYENLG